MPRKFRMSMFVFVDDASQEIAAAKAFSASEARVIAERKFGHPIPHLRPIELTPAISKQIARLKEFEARDDESDTHAIARLLAENPELRKIMEIFDRVGAQLSERGNIHASNRKH
jgi:hypothetical protein